MPHRKVIAWARCWTPRILGVAWGVWAASTAWAYVDGAPPQLATVEHLVVAPVWVLWATVAALLLVGSVIPPGVPGQRAAGWLRGIGLALTAGLLSAWAVEFFVEGGRGPVSGKNYALLALIALHHSWWIGRHRFQIREVQ